MNTNPIHKKAAMKSLTKLLMMLALTVGSAFAQTSAITATITDPDAQTWNNGTYTITFIPAPNAPGPSTWTGGALVTQFTGSISNVGLLSVSVADNTFVSPPGSKWQFTLCPNAAAPCQNVVTAVSGASPNLSTTLSNGLIAPRFGPGQFAYGYLDGEVIGPFLPGAAYFNVTSVLQRIWTGSAWINNTSSGGSGTVGNCGTSGTIAWYASSGTTIGCDANLTDLANVLSYLGSGGISTPSLTTTSAGASILQQGQGADNSSLCGTGQICDQAPTSVTKYITTRAGAGPGSQSIKVYSALSGSNTTETFNSSLPSGLVPATVVQNNQVNTGTTAFTLNASASTVANALRIPSQAGATSDGTSSINYDTTAGNFHGPIAGADAIIFGSAAAPTVNRLQKATDSTHGLMTNTSITEASAAGNLVTFGGGSGIALTGTGNQIAPSQGTITVSTPFETHTGTWNAAGVAFTNWLSNVTCTAAATGSKLFAYQVGGAEQISLTFGAATCTSPQLLIPNGTAALPGVVFESSLTSGLYQAATNITGISSNGNANMIFSGGGQVTSTGVYKWSSTGTITAAADAGISRDAADIIDFGNGTQGNASAFTKSGDTVRVASDFTTAANTSLQTITGLAWTLPATGTHTFSFECNLIYSQATANAAVAFGIQAATNSPTAINAGGQEGTSLTAFTTGSLRGLATTTATNIVSATPSASGAIGTAAAMFDVRLHGTIENPATTANTINIMVSTATSGDAVTVYRGSECHFTP